MIERRGSGCSSITRFAVARIGRGPVQHDDSTERRPKGHKIEFYGFDRSEADKVKITRRLSETLGAHAGDVSAT